ncbi:unnamed protein product, partial [Timema podura]|nr:unnamed protein product [Timema podura]
EENVEPTLESDKKEDPQNVLNKSAIPEKAKNAVLVESAPLPKGTPTVKGYDWNRGVNYSKLLETFRYSGFQATNFGLAVEEIKKMVALNFKKVGFTSDSWWPWELGKQLVEGLGLKTHD